jgi:hypothetical protein
MKIWGEFRELPVEMLEDPRVANFHDHLVRVEGMEPEMAEALIRDLLETRLGELADTYVRAMNEHVRIIYELRRQLTQKYNQVLELIRTSGEVQLPAELRPEVFDALFDALDAELDALRDPESYSRDVSLPGDVDMANLKVPGGPRKPATLEPEAPAAALFDDPMGYQRRPPVSEQWRLERRVVIEAERRSGADPVMLERVIEAADRFSTRMRPRRPGWSLDVRKTENFGPFLEQQAALRDLDPDFAGNGYEVVLGSPEGKVYRPDGVIQHGETFELADYKTTMTNEPGYYATQEGQTVLAGHMTERARMSLDLEGCDGWVYGTSNPELLPVLERIAGRVMARYPELRGRVTVRGF